jgi:hexosaminidase
MSWQGVKGGIEAAKQNHQAIMTPEPYLYLNWSQTRNEDSVSFGRYTPLEKVYNYEPVPNELSSQQAKLILGAQGNLWTEYIKNTSILEYNLFPRMSALSELVWSPKERKDYADFEKRLEKQFARYALWGANYSKAYFEIQSTISPTKSNVGVLWTLESKSKAPIFLTDAATRAGMKYSEPLPILGSGKWEATLMEDRKLLSKVTQTFYINKATGKKVTLTTPPSQTYPGSGGAFGLVNGIVSDRGFNSPEWLGWNGKNMEAFIDLEKPEEISKVAIDVWKQEPSWIYLPKSVSVFTSTDGTIWSSESTATPINGTWPDERKITVNLKEKTTARYLRVVAENYGIILQGRQGEGNRAWVFVDEIEVN